MKLVLFIPPDEHGAWCDDDIVRLAFVWADNKLKQAASSRFVEEVNDETPINPVLELLVYKWDDSVLTDREIAREIAKADWLAVTDIDRISDQAERIVERLLRSFPWQSVDIIPCDMFSRIDDARAKGEETPTSLWSYAGASSFKGCIPLLS